MHPIRHSLRRMPPNPIGSKAPLYLFGYGLSYITFSLSKLSTALTLSTTRTLQATVQLTNTRIVAGEQVVQADTHQRAGPASRPIR
jgi:beta-glucosidase